MADVPLAALLPQVELNDRETLTAIAQHRKLADVPIEIVIAGVRVGGPLDFACELHTRLEASMSVRADLVESLQQLATIVRARIDNVVPSRSRSRSRYRSEAYRERETWTGLHDHIRRLTDAGQ
jgi:hypothetical protein